MDLFDAIKDRYSHKGAFLPDPVPLAHLTRIANAGLMAPSGNNSQCVRLVILHTRAQIEPLYALCNTVGLQTAPAAIALFTDSSTQTGRINFEMEDYSAATQNILLAATALGYSSLWLDSPWLTNEDTHQAARDYLGAPESHRLRVVNLIGLPDGPGARREKMPLEERLSYGKFGIRKP